MGAAEKINNMSGNAQTNWLRTIRKISHLVTPTENRSRFVTYSLIAAALILLPTLPHVIFMACNCKRDSKKKAKYDPIPTLHAGQTTETISFTEIEYRTGRMTRERKIELDNLSIRNNLLAALNGIHTKADETPGEWERYRE